MAAPRTPTLPPSTFLKEEALLFGRYILKKQPDDSCLALYEQAMEKLHISLDKDDEKILHFIRQHPWSVGMFDAGLAFVNPYSQIRRKIFVMLAILETQPQYALLFLPRKRRIFYLAYIFFVGCRAASKAVLGAFLVKGLRSWRRASAS